MKISIVIPYFNNAASLVKVLESLILINKSHKIQVVIVDDCSDDFNEYSYEIYNRIRKIQYYNIIHLWKNRGRAYARNIGVKKAFFENVLFLDADRLLSKKAFSSPVFSDQYIESGIRIGPIFDTYIQLKQLNNIDKFMENPEMVRKYSYYRFIENFVNDNGCIILKNSWLATFSGAMLISKKNFYTVGGFDADFKKWGMENLELGFRISNKLGLKYHIEKSFVTYHLVHKRDKNFYNDGIKESTEIFYQKWHDDRVLKLRGLLQGTISVGEFENNPDFSQYYYKRPLI
ncbi:glycosyltransferase family 2 protein [Lactobacillus sp. DCY120]|uniref:Glycosyltransferase family 2 protein n=1 Tax=Bombilactobacillus apium TaxID=2675299 RepID=A0A850R477_9LACO|nr:glycosyltransferase [Bombilactobacillus apium]NVY97170.1 glycosyltransferase family 2 protein [Bombilactobacillus apium]